MDPSRFLFEKQNIHTVKMFTAHTTETLKMFILNVSSDITWGCPRYYDKFNSVLLTETIDTLFASDFYS